MSLPKIKTDPKMPVDTIAVEQDGKTVALIENVGPPSPATAEDIAKIRELFEGSGRNAHIWKRLLAGYDALVQEKAVLARALDHLCEKLVDWKQCPQDSLDWAPAEYWECDCCALKTDSDPDKEAECWKAYAIAEAEQQEGKPYAKS